MTLLINNAEVAKVLTMETTMAALEEAYLALAAGEAVCRPRIDIRIPTRDPAKNYQWGTMEGGSTAGYFAIRMKSDVISETRYNGSTTQEKYCTRPGRYCGLILLTSIETGEPLAFINDGYLQHMRVGADGGIGVKYLAKADAEVVGMLGSGGMARTHMPAFTRVRDIKRLQVYSPTRENREQFGREMAQTCNIEVVVCDQPEAVYKGADINRRCDRFGGAGARRHAADAGRACHQCRRRRQARRGDAAAGRHLSALRRHAGAGRPARARDRRRTPGFRSASRPGEIR